MSVGHVRRRASPPGRGVGTPSPARWRRAPARRRRRSRRPTPAAAEPLASTHGVDAVVSCVDLVGRRAAGDRAVGDDRLRRCGRAATRPSASARRARSAWATRTRRRLRRELGEQPLGPRARPARGRRAGRPPSASAAAVAGPTAASRSVGWPAAAGPARAGAVGRRDDEPVERGEPGERGAQRDAAVDRVADLDQRHVHDRRAQRGEAVAELARSPAG